MESKNYISRITIIPTICHGKPTIRGLRYPVENMLELLAGGMTFEEILDDYPDLEKEDLLACLEYAVKVTQTEKYLPSCFVKFVVDAQLPRKLSYWLRD